MINSTEYTYMTWAPIYREKGFWPRPVAPGTKVAEVKDWERPDPELSANTTEFWTYDFADHGIGIIMGNPFPDGTVLGALQINCRNYTDLGRVLPHKPVCGCLGVDGATLFVRFHSGQYRGISFKSGELFSEQKFCVLPPTIDPDTKWPYRWLGTPLHAADYADLPVIEA